MRRRHKDRPRHGAQLLRGGLVFACLILALAAAGSAAARPDARPSASAVRTLTHLKFRLDFAPDGRYAPFYLAQQRGYYAKHGIDLEIIPGTGSADAVKFLGTDAVDLALVDPLVAVQAKGQKIPIASVGVYLQRSPMVLVSRASNAITSPRGMIGKKIGVVRTAATYLGLQMVLRLAGINQSQVQFVDVGPSVAPLLVGQVDGLMGFSFNQPVAIESQGLKVHSMLLWNYGVKAYGLGLMANDSLLSHPAAIKGFLAATREGIAAVLKSPSAGVDAFLKANPSANKDLETARLAKTIPFFTSASTKQHGLLWQTPQMWATTIRTALQANVVQQAPSAAGLWTDKFLDNTAKKATKHKAKGAKKHKGKRK